MSRTSLTHGGLHLLSIEIIVTAIVHPAEQM